MQGNAACSARLAAAIAGVAAGAGRGRQRRGQLLSAASSIACTARGFVNLWRAGGARDRASRPCCCSTIRACRGMTRRHRPRRQHGLAQRGPLGAVPADAPDDKAEADAGIRVLEIAKSNYAPRGNPIRLQWADGGLAFEAVPSSMHRMAKEAECDECFLQLLDELAAQGRDVSANPSTTYAPKVFAGMDGANKFTKEAFARAMERLFHARTIEIEQFGPPSKRRTRIIRGAHAHMGP